MRRSIGPTLALRRSLVAATLALTLGGCTSPGSQRIIGPDGSPMAHVHCGREQGTCFRMAGELCPFGYDIRPVLSGNDGNFLVRCHAPNTVVASAPAPIAPPLLPPPLPTHATPAQVAAPAPPAQTWPPSPEPARAANPWPSPQTSTATRRTPTGELDLGY